LRDVRASKSRLRGQFNKAFIALNCARDALVDDFRSGAPVECKDTYAARHRLDHHQT
jgi:hypothetical protein